MLGNKARQIRDLRAAKEACDSDHGPFIELAKEIGQRVVASSGDMMTGLDEKITLIVRDLTDERRKSLVREQFNQLPPESRFAILSKLFGDKELTEALEIERQKALQKTEHEKRLDSLAEQAGAKKRLDLGLIPNGSIVSFGLFNAAEVDDPLSSNYLSLGRSDRILRAVSLGDDRFQVLSDIIYGFDEDSSPKPNFADNQIISIGTGSDVAHFSNVVYRGGVLNCIKDPLKDEPSVKALWIDDEYDEGDIDLVLGRVSIDDHVIM